LNKTYWIEIRLAAEPHGANGGKNPRLRLPIEQGCAWAVRPRELLKRRWRRCSGHKNAIWSTLIVVALRIVIAKIAMTATNAAQQKPKDFSTARTGTAARKRMALVWRHLMLRR